MIRITSPRCFTVDSDLPEQIEAQQFRLDDILTVELVEGPRHGNALAVDLLSGQRVIAGRYSDPSEAGADFGKLRVLLGMSAWPDEWEQNTEDTPDLISRLGRYISLPLDFIISGLAASRARTSHSSPKPY